jgi:hypothetical protein
MSFLSVEVQYLSTNLDPYWIDIINYSYELGFLIGCLFSERYYTSNVQREAVILAYSLTTFSSVSLSLYKIFKGYFKSFELVIAFGYAFSGAGQALLIIVMVAYATPYVQLYPKSALLPIIMGLLNFTAAVGALLTYTITLLKYSEYVSLCFNGLLLGLSILISWNLKELPRSYTISVCSKPEVPFSYFSIAFYAYGVRFI